MKDFELKASENEPRKPEKYLKKWKQNEKLQNGARLDGRIS